MLTHEKGKINYINKLVVFLDLLGFGDIIVQAGNNPEKILRIRNLLESTKSYLSRINQIGNYGLEIKSEDFKYYFFSDTIIMSCSYYSDEYLLALFVWVMSYQITICLEEGVFTRGAVVYDDIYEEQDLVFGPALLKAYDVERKLAVWPRSVVTQSVIDEAQKRKHEGILNHLAKDEVSKLFFLDYLYFLPLLIGAKRNYEQLSDYLNSHKLKICNSIEKVENDSSKSRKDKRNIINKYKSLIIYHNHTVNEIYMNIDSLINDKSWLGNIRQNAPIIDTVILKDDIKSALIDEPFNAS